MYTDSILLMPLDIIHRVTWTSPLKQTNGSTLEAPVEHLFLGGSSKVGLSASSFGHPASWNPVNSSNQLFIVSTSNLSQHCKHTELWSLSPNAPTCSQPTQSPCAKGPSLQLVAMQKRNRSIHSLASFNSSGESSGNNSLFLHLVTFQTKKSNWNFRKSSVEFSIIKSAKSTRCPHFLDQEPELPGRVTNSKDSCSLELTHPVISSAAFDA